MICAIILAAGQSRRMGTQKLLLPLGNSTLIARITDTILASGVDRTFIIIREPADEIRAVLAPRPLHFVENPDPQGDMLSSVRCGLRALPPQCTLVLVTPADMPALTPSAIQQLLSAQRSGNRHIVVPTHHGRRGHPLLFSTSYCPEIMQNFDDTGLRGLLAAHPADILEVPLADPGILQDLDLPADYDRAKSSLP